MAESILNALLFKEKPKLPKLPKLSAQEEQMRAIEGNLAALPKAQEIAAGINTFNQAQLLSMLRAAIPGYDEIMETGGRQINSFLRGEVPADVQRAIERSSSAKALAGGYAGSQFHGMGTAESLGLTSLDLIQRGLNAADQWIARSRQSSVPNLWDASSMFLSPAQQINFAQSERAAQWNYQWFKNQLKAQPEPWERAVGGLMDWIATTGESVAGAYMGNLAGSFGSGQQQQQQQQLGFGGRGGIPAGAGWAPGSQYLGTSPGGQMNFYVPPG